MIVFSMLKITGGLNKFLRNESGVLMQNLHGVEHAEQSCKCKADSEHGLHLDLATLRTERRYISSSLSLVI